MSRFKNLKVTDTFFDSKGEIVCVTRISYSVIYGVYCTGKLSEEVNEKGECVEFGFFEGDIN